MADDAIKPTKSYAQTATGVTRVGKTPPKKGVDEKERRRNPKKDWPETNDDTDELTYRKDGGLTHDDQGPTFEGDA